MAHNVDEDINASTSHTAINMANNNIAAMKLTDLKQRAKQMGIHGYSSMRKTDLISAIESAGHTNFPREAKHRNGIESEDMQSRAYTRSRSEEKQYARDSRSSDDLTSLNTRRRSRMNKGDEDRSYDEFDDVDNADIRGERRRRRQDDDDNPMDYQERSNRADLEENEELESSEERRKDRRNRRHDKSRRNRERNRKNRNRDGRDDNENDNDDLDQEEIRSNKNRKQRREDNEREGSDRNNDPQLFPVAGIVDILDSYAFVRTSGYLPGQNDVYVSMSVVKKYGLRKGDAIQGLIRAPRDGERNKNSRQKLVPLQSVSSINGISPEEAFDRPQFNKLTPLYPNERLKMETKPEKITGRIIDIIDPIGKGQRGLIVAPPKAGKTATLQAIANSVAENNPECYLMVLLVDERPEEVTDMERSVRGEVISSTFDQPASSHTIVAELAIERAKRLVEMGKDVVLLLDSMTRLARAYNIAQPASGRVLSGGVDAQALYPPKKFFGAARNIEDGGSLTIIATALVETGSKMDEVIFEEFKGTGNMELCLSRELSNKRLFPAIDINSSSTRREELLTPPSELAVIYRLHRLLGSLDVEAAYQALVPRLKQTQTNEEFFQTVIQSMNQSMKSNTPTL